MNFLTKSILSFLITLTMLSNGPRKNPMDKERYKPPSGSLEDVLGEMSEDMKKVRQVKQRYSSYEKKPKYEGKVFSSNPDHIDL